MGQLNALWSPILEFRLLTPFLGLKTIFLAILPFWLSGVIFDIWSGRVMKTWLNAYIWTLSNMKKNGFSKFPFLRGLPITLSVKNRPIFGCPG